MNKTITTSIALALITAAPLAIACDYPTRADIPNGMTANKDDMISGQRSVKAYMSAMEEYLACIDQEENLTVAGMPELSEEEKAARDAALTKKHNAAVEDMELTAARFNEQVRAYKAQSE